MNLLSRLFRYKSQNPYYTKLKKSLTRGNVSIEIKSAYFLFGIPYQETDIDKLKKAIIENKLNELRESNSYNVQVDNVELYLVEDKNAKLYVIFLLDPYELYSSESILDIMPVESKNFEKEIIFP